MVAQGVLFLLFLPIFSAKMKNNLQPMTMLTRFDCQRRSSHSPYILELYIWKKEFTIQVLSDRLVQLSIFRCNKRQTDNDSRLHSLK